MKSFVVNIGGTDIEVPISFGKYEIVKLIGYGSFSVVALVSQKGGKDQYACKICSRRQLIESNTFERFEQEVRLLQSLHHPNIVAVVDVCYDENLIYLLLEYCSNGELFQYIVEHGRLNGPLCQKVFANLVSALVYLHSRDIAHRDLKPENILLTSNNDPKIADFGLCHISSINHLLSTPCGSPFYAPPEIISNEEYDGKAGDVWSLGVVLYMMATGFLPWRDENQAHLFEAIKTADFEVPPFVPAKIADLIRAMMNPVPADRPTMAMILNDPWVREYLDSDSTLIVADFPLRIQQSSPGFAMTAPLNRAPPSFEHARPQRRRLIVRPTVASANWHSKIGNVQAIESLIRRVPGSGKHRLSNIGV